MICLLSFADKAIPY